MKTRGEGLYIHYMVGGGGGGGGGGVVMSGANPEYTHIISTATLWENFTHIL